MSDSKNFSEDPHAVREAEKYDRPIASRELIMQLLDEQGEPLTRPQLEVLLEIADEESSEALRRRLRAMERDGQLMRNRKAQYVLLSKLDLVAGRIMGHRDGFGFLIPDEAGDDIFLSAREMRQVFDGDRVLVRATGQDRKGRTEGVIVEVLERKTRKLVGRFQGQGGFGYMTPENQRITNDIQIMPDPDSGLKYRQGQLVVVELITPPSKRAKATARVTEVLGDHMAAGMEIKVAIHNYDIPNEWTDAIRQEVSEFGPDVPDSAVKNRVDLRELPLVTIDGEDAKDFDDAVYCEPKRSGGWRLWVAIADVSAYVHPASELDVEAHKRGNSVYFPEFVVPMLPEMLSNGLCSLNPDVNRLAMVCEMTISASGNMSGYQFYEAVIRSKARLTYTKVGAMLQEPDSDFGKEMRQQYTGVLPHIEHLNDLYRALKKAREERGAIDFDTTETRIMFSEERKIEKIIPVVRNDAHKIIEECMLCANVATAKMLQKLKQPALFRVHDGPKESKLINLRTYLGPLGLSLGGGEEPTPQDYQALTESLEGRMDKHVIQIMMLRSMSQAVYSPEHKGHFGLNYPAYTHFTSPIRRYPDLLVHRAIRGLIHSGNDSRHLVRPDDFLPNKKYHYNYTMEQVVELGEHCSMTERRADDATRDVMAWLKCEYMQDCVGDEFAGVISAVTGFGVFVELEEVYVEGLIHISALPGDYYQFDAPRQRLQGERTGKSFRLGDRVKVQVVRVDLDDRKIDFELVKQLNAADKQPTGADGEVKRLSKREMLRKGKIQMAELESQQGRKPGRSKHGSAKPASARSGAKSGPSRKRTDSDSPWGKAPDSGASGERATAGRPPRKRGAGAKSEQASRQKPEAKPDNGGKTRLSESELEVIRLSKKQSKGLSNRAKKRKLKKLRGKSSHKS
ncbi:ribonuclease R [Amphritea japonica]|uniref:Ribonuclease R n=1 Tax=Amphritea japonica ATCC BAA-1530 TaxID=1278309 RepID=A0A7R6P570_9GAMM|nr:ribonuclease R [Amphritea japonica]BBB27543.1 ribonuclease R [Amphritea japonica ATCC BAA-1530]